jgi:hypothetical protein
MNNRRVAMECVIFVYNVENTSSQRTKHPTSQATLVRPTARNDDVAK